MNRAWTLNEFIYTMRFHFFEVNFDYTSNRATIHVDIYSNNYDFVPLPLPSRYRFWASVSNRYGPLLNVTDRY
jgi:hypothetical protein